jgi:hypothetical protein
MSILYKLKETVDLLPYFKGNSPYLEGKMPYFKGNSPYLEGKTPYFKGNFPYLEGKISVPRKKFHRTSKEKSPYFKGKNIAVFPCKYKTS